MDPREEWLEPRLQKALEQLKPFPPREARATARGRAQFLTQAHSLQSAVPARSFWRPISWDHLFPRKEQFRMAPIIALILSLTLAVGGSGAAVYAAQDALPNDPLYAVKILSEDARVNLTSDSEARANLMLDLAARRTSEIAATNGANADVLARQQVHIASALQIAAGLSDAQMNQVLARTRDVLDQGLQTMDATPALSDARAVLGAERAFTQNGLDDQAAFRARFQNAAAASSPVPTDLPAPPFTSTLPITGTWPAPPPPHGTPPFTATLPITGTWPAPPPWGTPPFTATFPITETLPAPPPPHGTPPFTATLPITGTWPAPPPHGTPPFTATLSITGTWLTPPPPGERGTPTGTLQPKVTPASGSTPQPRFTPASGSTPQPRSTPVPGSTPQPKSTPVAPPPQPPSQPTSQQPSPRGTGK